MQCRASAIHSHLREDLGVSDWRRSIDLYEVVREAVNNELDLAASSVVCIDRHGHHGLDPKGTFGIGCVSDRLFDALQHSQSQIKRLQASHLGREEFEEVFPVTLGATVEVWVARDCHFEDEVADCRKTRLWNHACEEAEGGVNLGELKSVGAV